MGAGGTAGMIASNRANLALRRRDRKRVFEPKTKCSWNKLGQDTVRPVCSPATAKQNREKFLVEKKREEQVGWMKTIGVLIIFAVFFISVFL